MTTAASATIPSVEIPRRFNAAAEYIDGPLARGHGARTAYLCDGEQVSYTQLQRRVNQTASALARLGVEMEQRMVVLLPNQPEFVYALFGAMRIGAVAAAMSTAIQPAEQALLLADSRARAIVTSEALWAPLRAQRGEFPFLKYV